MLHERGLSTAVGDEGGFAPDLGSNEEAARSCSSRPSRRPASRPGDDIAIALDVASTEFFAGRRATSWPARAATLSPAEMVGLLADLCGRYPIVSIEDGMAEEDWDGWAAAHRARSATGCSSSATTCSSPTSSASRAASTPGVANSILVKVNQIGTLTETLDDRRPGHPRRLHAR